MEATLVIMGADEPDAERTYPYFVVGMAPLHKPGHEPGQNAIRALRSVHERGHPARWCAGDRAYTNAQPEHFQLPVRALGYEPVLDYRLDQLGVQGTYAGAIHVEGGRYCPAMPQTLIDATKDLREGRIDEAVWQERIAARERFAFRAKANPDAEGHQRLMCPAAGTAPTIRCDHKPRSQDARTAGKGRTRLSAELVTHPPTVCEQETVTFPPDANTKLRQKLPFGSPEWARTYHALRATIEGVNGFVKDHAKEAAGEPGKRRIRGMAAQSLFLAFLLFASNWRKIDTFLESLNAEGTVVKLRSRRRTTKPIQDWDRPVPPPASLDPPPNTGTR
jgi:hypothetical protein